MGDTRWNKYGHPRACSFGSVRIAEGQMALQDVPSFVIGMVNVKDCRPLPRHSWMLNEVPVAEKFGTRPSYYRIPQSRTFPITAFNQALQPDRRWIQLSNHVDSLTSIRPAT